MKKIFSILLAIVLIASVLVAFVGCDNKNETPTTTFTITAPDGAPALALGKVLEGNSPNGVKMKTQVVSTTELSAAVLKSDYAIVPANLAVNLLNKGKQIKLLSVVTNGNIYVVGNMNNQTSLQDMVGKVVYSIGQGSVPDMIFQSVLRAKGIEYVTSDSPVEGKIAIKYVSAGGQGIQSIMADKSKGISSYAVLGEPAVGVAKSKGATEQFDLQAEWQAVSGESQKGFAQAVLIAVGERSKDDVNNKKMVEIFEQNDSYVVQNSQSVIEKIKEVYPSTSLPSTLPVSVVERCNIKTLRASANKSYIDKTLEAIMQINPQALGGKLPPADFYF